MPEVKSRRRVSLHSHPKLTRLQLYAISVEATCDPRSIVKYLHKLEVTTTTRARVEKALRALGFASLVHGAMLASTTSTNGASVVANGASASSSSSSSPPPPSVKSGR